MLEIRNLGVRYGRHLALDGVSASVGKGEICVVLGANGAGKSSLLKAVAGMVATAPGSEVTMNGRSLVGMKPHRIVEEGIALVPEGRGIFGDLTVAENLSLGAFAKRARSREAATLQRIYETFPRLAERKRQVARTMSGGEQQMVAIGRALMSNPEILMLDEPSLGLSPLLTKDMFKSLSAIAATGVGILLVEQNARQSLRIAGRGYLIENGAIAGENSAEALMSDPAVISTYLGGASARSAPTPPRISLPRPFGLPAGAAAIGRFVGDLAGRAQRIQTAFVRQLRRDGGLPSAFVGRYDPKAGGDPWKHVEAELVGPSQERVKVSEDARRVGDLSAMLARRAAERLALHVGTVRLSAPVPSAFHPALRRAVEDKPALASPARPFTEPSSSVAFSPDELAGRAAERLARHLAEIRKAAPVPSAFERPLHEVARPAASPMAGLAPEPSPTRKLNGTRGLIGHNSAAAGIAPDEAETQDAAPVAIVAAPATSAGVSIADLVARAAAVQKRHVDEARKSLTAFTLPAAGSAPRVPVADTPAPPQEAEEGTAADVAGPDPDSRKAGIKAKTKAGKKSARKGKKHKAKKSPAKHQEA